jgi:hypothetical protein
MVDVAQPTSHFNHNRRIRRLFSYKVLRLLIFNRSRLLGEETVKVNDFRNPSLAAVGQNDRMKARIEQESVSCNLQPVDLSDCSRRQLKKQPQRPLLALMAIEWLPIPPFTP